MGFSASIKSGFSNYFNFSGRASRSEHWYFFLFCIIASIVAGIVDGVIGIGLVEGLYQLVNYYSKLSTFLHENA